MNEQLYKQLKKINTAVLRNIEFLLEEQETQIKKAIEENIISDSFYKEKLQNVLDKFTEEAEEIREQVSNANTSADKLYAKVDEASSYALEVADTIESALRNLNAMTKSIENEKLNPFKEAA